MILDAIAIWRKATVPQTLGLFIAHDGSRCAIGVLAGEEANDQPQAAALLDDGEFLREHYNIGGDETLVCPLDGCEDALYGGAEVVEHWNDTHHLAFSEIADMAEKYPQAVFLGGERA